MYSFFKGSDPDSRLGGGVHGAVLDTRGHDSV